jgi:predicted nuclease of predicted toxin-antitoxin system
LAADIRFYLDENVQVTIADQLRRRGIEVVTTRDLDALGDSDENHLARASEMGYVLCTHDTDFVRLAAQGIPHKGIVFGRLGDHSIGDWVKHLALIHGVLAPEEMENHVEYL